MSQENLDAVRSLYTAFNKLAGGGDIASYVTAHFDPDCEYEPIEEQETIHGQQALVRWNERWFEGWEEFGVDIEELIEAGEGTIVAVFTAHGRGAESGMQINQCFSHVLDLRKNKVQRVREYLDRDEALEAARLRE